MLFINNSNKAHSIAWKKGQDFSFETSFRHLACHVSKWGFCTADFFPHKEFDCKSLTTMDILIKTYKKRRYRDFEMNVKYW